MTSKIASFCFFDSQKIHQKNHRIIRCIKYRRLNIRLSLNSSPWANDSIDSFCWDDFLVSTKRIDRIICFCHTHRKLFYFWYMSFMHSKDTLYKDFKPENILHAWFPRPQSIWNQRWLENLITTRLWRLSVNRYCLSTIWSHIHRISLCWQWWSCIAHTGKCSEVFFRFKEEHFSNFT